MDNRRYVDAVTPAMPCYRQVEKSLLRNAHELGVSLDAVLLYAKLCNRARLSCANGWVDEQGRVFVTYTRNQYMKETGCSKKTAVKHFRELVNAGLTEEVAQTNRAGCTVALRIYPKKWVEPTVGLSLADIADGALDYLTPWNVNAALGSYIQIPDTLMQNKDLSNRAKVLYAIAWDLTRLSISFGRLDKEGHYWCEVEAKEAMMLLDCCRDALSRAYRELTDAQLITRVRTEYGCSMHTYVHPCWEERNFTDEGEYTSDETPHMTELVPNSEQNNIPQVPKATTRERPRERESLSYHHGQSICAPAHDVAEAERNYRHQIEAVGVQADLGRLLSGKAVDTALRILDLAIAVVAQDVVNPAKKLLVAGSYVDKQELVAAYERVDRYIMDTLIAQCVKGWESVRAPVPYLRAALYGAYEQYEGVAYHTRLGLDFDDFGRGA